MEKARLREERPDLAAVCEAEQAEAKRMREALVSGAYPGMGKGDPNLYKTFCWRFWQLAAEAGGRIGVVLLRSALAAKGSTEFRHAMFAEAAGVDITTLLNRAGWVFDEAEHRYTIALICIEHGASEDRSISLRGPYASRAAFEAGRSCRHVRTVTGAGLERYRVPAVVTV